jgi:hypothetical protein
MYARKSTWQRQAAELAGWYDEFQSSVTGAYAGAKQRLQNQGEALWSSWQHSVKTLATMRGRVKAQQARPAKLAAANNLGRRLESLVAMARGIAAELKVTATWDTPSQFAQTHLGVNQRSAESALLFYANDVGAMARDTGALERDLVALERS